MKSFFALIAVFSLTLLSPLNAHAVPSGEAAPDFTLQDTSGNEVSLSDYAGKTVILEWTNRHCPYVRKHYDSGNMQQLQQQAANNDMVWLTILSSAPGKQGYLEPAEAAEVAENEGAANTAMLLDPAGEVGKLYNAKTTPHMYIIDAEGILQYQGAIDDDNSADIASVETAKNHVLAALADMDAGRPVAEPVTQPYGCAVKY